MDFDPEGGRGVLLFEPPQQVLCFFRKSPEPIQKEGVDLVSSASSHLADGRLRNKSGSKNSEFK